jgi:hypothetical protein
MPYDFNNKEAEQIVEQMYRTGFTQEGVDRIYAILGLGTAPRVPAGLIGNRPNVGRTSMMILDANGKRVGTRSGEIADFLNDFGKRAVDPYREYGVGNYLGVAGLLAGGAGAAGAFTGAAAAPGAATGSNLGVFANGGTAGMAGVGGGNAGLLASTGGIAGGAGIGGTAAGALGGFGNALLGSGGGMGWDWGNILEYGIPVIGGLLEGRGAKDAADAQSAGALAAVDENRRQYDTTRADMMPWLDAGRSALGRLENPNASFQASPDYEFVRNEGMRDIGNSFAAHGGAFSGNALRALAERNANVASGEFGNWWNRQAGVAGVGQTAAQNLGTLGANNSANIGNALMGAANARASGVVGQTNATTGVLSDLLSTWNRNRKPQGTWV